MKGDFIYTELVNVSEEYLQEHTLLLGSDTIFISLKYYEAVGAWFIDLKAGEVEIKGIKLTTGVEHLKFNNEFNYDFMIIGIDQNPTLLTDLKNCKICFYEKVQ